MAKKEKRRLIYKKTILKLADSLKKNFEVFTGHNISKEDKLREAILVADHVYSTFFYRRR